MAEKSTSSKTKKAASKPKSKTTAAKKSKTTAKKTTTKPKATKKVTKTAAKAAPKTRLKPKTMMIHYHRFDNNYDGWGIHLWDSGDNVIDEKIETGWDSPLTFEGEDEFGKTLSIPMDNGYGPLGLLVHKGDEKDSESDLLFTPNPRKREIWLVQGKDTIFVKEDDAKKALEG